jgi:hypothetical protein
MIRSLLVNGTFWQNRKLGAAHWHAPTAARARIENVFGHRGLINFVVLTITIYLPELQGYNRRLLLILPVTSHHAIVFSCTR